MFRKFLCFYVDNQFMGFQKVLSLAVSLSRPQMESNVNS